MVVLSAVYVVVVLLNVGVVLELVLTVVLRRVAVVDFLIVEVVTVEVGINDIEFKALFLLQHQKQHYYVCANK